MTAYEICQQGGGNEEVVFADDLAAAMKEAREDGYNLALDELALWDAGDCGQDAERYLYDRKKKALAHTQSTEG